MDLSRVLHFVSGNWPWYVSAMRCDYATTALRRVLKGRAELEATVPWERPADRTQPCAHELPG